MFSDRTSTHYMRSNQLRMYFSAFAYILMECVRREGLRGTHYAMAQCDTIRLKLIKIGTVVRTSARRVVLSFSESYPCSAKCYGSFRKYLRVESGLMNPTVR